MIPPQSMFSLQLQKKGLAVLDLRSTQITRYSDPSLLLLLDRCKSLLSRPWVAEQFFRAFQTALPKSARFRNLDALGEICEATNILTLLEHAWPKIFITYKTSALARLRPGAIFLSGSLVDSLERETDADKLASFHLQFYVLIIHELARYVALMLGETVSLDHRQCDRLRHALETGLLGGDVMAKPKKLHSLRVVKEGKPCWIRYRKVAERFWRSREFRPLSQHEMVPDGDFLSQVEGGGPKPLMLVFGCCLHEDKHI